MAIDAPDETAIIEKPAGKEKFDDDTDLLDGLIGDKDLLDMDAQEGKSTNKVAKNKGEEVIEDNDELLDDAEGGEPEDILIESNRGIDLAKIKEKYPDFAKTNEYKELRNAYHREAKYTEIFPELADAQEAAENNETFEKLNASLVGAGDPTQLLLGIKSANPESFKKVAMSFMDVLSKVDNNLYVDALTPIVKRLARQINAQGKRYLKHDAESAEGLALVGTARNILLYAFPDEDADHSLTTVEDKAEQKVSEREQELVNRENKIILEKYRNAYSVCATSVERHLNRIIEQGLDPDGKLSEFTKDALIEKIKNDIKSQIDKDTLHARRMTSLWKRAQQSDYSRESLSSIVSAYLERARPIIPTVRNKFRSLAVGKSARNEDDGDKTIRLRSRGVTGRAPERDGKINIKAVDSKKIDYSKTTDDDIFEGRVKVKG